MTKRRKGNPIAVLVIGAIVLGTVVTWSVAGLLISRKGEQS